MSISLLGWAATAAFAASYFFNRSSILMRIQAFAACLWVIYGLAIEAFPVVVSNLVVAGAATYSSFSPGDTPNTNRVVDRLPSAEE